MKFNKKGQGALEYLLLIGGAVLIAVIVIALLVGMGSQNSENSKTRNEEAMNATNVPIPSVINSVTCGAGNTYVINWTAVHKEGNNYSVIINNVEADSGDFSINAQTNPVVGGDGCALGHSVAIKTVSNNVAVVSADVLVK